MKALTSGQDAVVMMAECMRPLGRVKAHTSG